MSALLMVVGLVITLTTLVVGLASIARIGY